jgi:Mesyanzhinovviridae DNA polymerase I
MPSLTGDFETRGVLDLTTVGAWKYSTHPLTQVLCFAWAFHHEAEPYLWHRGHPAVGIPQSPHPEELCRMIEAGVEFEAHSAGFEYAVWNNCLRREFPEFPPLQEGQMRCSAAKAALYALPRSLGMACKVLRLRHQKDDLGRAVMLRVSKPKSLTKAEKATLGEDAVVWNEDPKDLAVTWEYCRDDVRAEGGLSAELPAMPPRELALWQMDQKMNRRGITCDVRGARVAMDMAGREVEALNRELYDMTWGAVPKGSSRTKFKLWAAKRGLVLPNTQADVLEEMLKRDKTIPQDLQRAIRISVDVNKTSTSKYSQMLEQVSEGDRLRDMMMFRGASRTGRWSGKGVQPHNFVRGYKDDMEDVWDRDILAVDPARLRLLYGSVMECLAKAARGALIAAPGKELFVADYAAIEARVLLWLAMDEAGLDIFRRGEDIYIAMAEDIYQREFVDRGMDYRAALKIAKERFPLERQLGKKAVLGLGYQMGGEKFDDECADEGIQVTREFCDKVVQVYREVRFPLVASLWAETESAAIDAVLYRGREFPCRRVAYRTRGRFLECVLPSGRPLRYYEPVVSQARAWTWKAVSKAGKAATIRITATPSEPVRDVYQRALAVAKFAQKRLLNQDPDFRDNRALTFMGMDQKTKQWRRMHTYGGSLVENNTQATAADLMGDAMYRAEESGLYDMLLSVHDELIAECDEGFGDVREFEGLMSKTEPWAEGIPVTAEGWKGRRYRK